MSQGLFRAAPYCVVFDGQSLNLIPGASTYPAQTMADLTIDGLAVPYTNVAKGAASWTVLTNGDASTEPAATRLFPRAHQGLVNILCLCGGTSDILEGDSGATIYADMKTYADDARSAGFDLIIGTTTTPFVGITGGQETARLAANVLILANGDGAFDSVVDFAADPLDDAADTTYYADGTHWNAVGAGVAAGLMRPAILSLV